MTRHQITTGSDFERRFGYARAVVDGDWIFVSGTTGYDYDKNVLPATVETQTRKALANIARTLAETRASLADVVRVRYYVSDRAHVRRIAPILADTFGEIRPAATMVLCEMIEPEMMIEIEVTALRRSREPD
ncbi:enamine deaminase RidA (YjgF/YER057c/UK114 family) [Breoghania corrubedonensis]|uniref:Enamine deaminase RidA (YjgF/YER057c/UK114 family) n=1 Tax=Breoghania corrubedonensis TaxID=665038 RepID=A0A2T5VI69_9HYPH|nr:RidA family protein [Breoghania corrubedonensis]PTW63452.1 enamine deaminase RidA (YjgF/YER057c/UK114 family) [Breoghania corrubedonensis]